MYGRYHVWITVIILISPKSLFLFCKRYVLQLVLQSWNPPAFLSFAVFEDEDSGNKCFWILSKDYIANARWTLFVDEFGGFTSTYILWLVTTGICFFCLLWSLVLTFNESNQSKIEWIIIATTSNKTCLADIWYWYPLLYPFNTQWVWV